MPNLARIAAFGAVAIALVLTGCSDSGSAAKPAASQSASQSSAASSGATVNQSTALDVLISKMKRAGYCDSNHSDGTPQGGAQATGACDVKPGQPGARTYKLTVMEDAAHAQVFLRYFKQNACQVAGYLHQGRYPLIVGDYYAVSPPLNFTAPGSSPPDDIQAIADAIGAKVVYPCG